MVVLLVAFLVGTGLAAHREAVRILMAKQPPEPGRGGPVQLHVTVRNRVAAIVPTRGAGGEPAWVLERRTPEGAWEAAPPPTAGATVWLSPFERRAYAAPVEEPGIYRATVYSGRAGEQEHHSEVVTVNRDDFDLPPNAR